MAIQLDNSVSTTITLAAPSSGSATLTFPSSDGTNGQTLITDGAGNLTWGAIPTAASAGLTTTESTTGTNATINIDALTVATSGSSTNQYMALIPKGAGSLVSFIPTSTAYGSYNVCFQKQTTASSVPSQPYNVIIGGDSNVVSGTASHVTLIGCSRTTVNGYASYSVGVGLCSPPLATTASMGTGASSGVGYCVAALAGSVAISDEGVTALMGPSVRMNRAYQHKLGGISYDPNGQLVPSYYSLTHYTGQTAGSGAGNAVFLYSDFNNSTTAGAFNVAGRSLIFFWGWLTAGQNSGNAAYVWEIAGLAISTGAALSFVGTPSVSALGGDTSLSTSVITLAISALTITIKAQSALTGTTNFQFTCNEISMGVY